MIVYAEGDLDPTALQARPTTALDAIVGLPLLSDEVVFESRTVMQLCPLPRVNRAYHHEVD